MEADPTGPVAELLSQLIRNGCVNDETVASGHEAGSADLLAGWLEGLLSERVGFDSYASMFHGDDKRVDLESLRLSSATREPVARDLLG